jgi:NlpC/P60 family putative phage cell wall peptidase
VTQILQRAAVASQALAWVGTPYHAQARVLGVGVDCVHLLCAVYEAAGVRDHIEPDAYARDWHLHHSAELYMQGLFRHAHLRPAGALPGLGDVLLFRFGRTFSHAGIVVDGVGQGADELTLVHAFHQRGVIRSRLGEEPLAGRECQLWSPWPDDLEAGA